MKSKKKLVIIIVSIVVVLVLLLGGFIVYTYTSSANDVWGIDLSVEDVSSTGLVLHMKRSVDDSFGKDLDTGNPFGLQRRTMFGWENVPGEFAFTMVAFRMDPGAEKTWNVNWESGCGKLPIGIYRISKSVSVEDYYQYEESERDELEQTYYEVFFVGIM